jgi:hypothetical protein
MEPSGTDSYSEENHHVTTPNPPPLTSKTCVQSRCCAIPDNPRTILRTPITSSYNCACGQVETNIVSSWKTKDKAVLAIRHLLNPSVISQSHWDIKGFHAPSSCHFQERDTKDGYEAKVLDGPTLTIKHLVEKGKAGT